MDDYDKLAGMSAAEILANCTLPICNTTLEKFSNGSMFKYAFGGNSRSKEPDGLTISWDSWEVLFTCFNALIFIIGMIGNGLVIFVVLRYAKMKTVTNMYIVNLAFADLCFLTGTPFLLTTTLVRRWVFGFVICKIFYVLTSINWFTSVFTLTVMSADRYLAVCHPIESMKYRTAIVSRIVCICIWSLSLLAMLPIILYATTVHNKDTNTHTCTIMWPDGQPISADTAFIWYGMLLGFAIPVSLISVFYTFVLLRLRRVGPKRKSRELKKSHRKVTKLVLTVITVYIICWLPYWLFQIALTFNPSRFGSVAITLFRIFTLMSYSNSMLNPLLYAFLSDNFRKSFIKAFHCVSHVDVNKSLHVEQTVFPTGKKQPGSTCGSKQTKTTAMDEEHNVAETAMTHNVSAYDIISAPAECKEAQGKEALLTQL